MNLRVAACCLALFGSNAALAQEPIATAFSQSVAAIVVEGDEVFFLMVEKDQKEPRVLSEGDAFRDGWTVKEATPQSAVLRRGPMSVVVDLTRFKPPGEARQAPERTPANAGRSEASRAG